MNEPNKMGHMENLWNMTATNNGGNGTDSRAMTLGRLVSQRRAELGLSLKQLAQRSGYATGSLHNFEHDRTTRISPQRLKRLAAALEIPATDLYSAAGIELPTELPTFTPYLRARYRGLPESAQQELQRSFDRIASKYGYDPDGPRPGQDEK
jgi:transcriptional regulator with XRE-family HTH domain